MPCVKVLSSGRQDSLFAPVDAAFATLGLTKDDVCTTFDGEPGSIGAPAALLDVLLYHVRPGRVPPVSSPPDRRSRWPQWRRGRPRVDGKLAVDDAKIMIHNVPASNRFVHAVDAVLLP